MNWDDLRIFLALCREGTASAAARVLGVNHTTVARRISALERALNTRLFDRGAEGYTLTQAAENLYPHALAMEASAQAIERTIAGRDAELAGPLRLTVPYDFAASVLVPILGEFRRRYPAITVQLLTTTQTVDLSAREADIAVRLTARPPDYLVGREVLPVRHGLYVAPDYLSSLDGAPPEVLLFRGDSEFPDWGKKYFPQARSSVRIDNLGTLLAAVSEGLGIARLPCFAADTRSDIVRLERPLQPSPWRVWVLSHVDLRTTARVRVAREFLVEAIERARPLILGERSRYLDESEQTP